MKPYKLTALMATMVLAMCILSGCTTFENFKEAFIDKPQNQSDTIQIGIYEPMSGADSEASEPEIEGIRLAYSQYPEVGGKKIELVYGDNASDIYAAETAIKDLIVKEPAVILGSYGSVYSLVAGDFIREAKIPTIAITNTNPLVTSNNSYYFRVCYVDSNQGDLLAKYVLEQKQEVTAGVLLPEDDDAAMSMATTFTDRIKVETENEDAITVYEQYKTGDQDFTEQLETVRASGVKSVLLPGNMNDSVKIIEQAADMGLDDVVFLGDSEWATDDFRKRLSSDVKADSMAFVNFFAAEESSSHEAEVFLEAYEKIHGKNSTPE
ncbi:MAG: ABC transporter substrate-binding protein, partial [Bacillota bacterium]|nr:ABC transporter substrate-binding protein [Bacillota bacterium]